MKKAAGPEGAWLVWVAMLWATGLTGTSGVLMVTEPRLEGEPCQTRRKHFVELADLTQILL